MLLHVFWEPVMIFENHKLHERTKWNICSMVQILYMCSYIASSPFPRGRPCAPRLSFGDVLHMLACGHLYNHILHQWVLLSSWEINFSDCLCKYLESRVSLAQSTPVQSGFADLLLHYFQTFIKNNGMLLL